MGVAVNVEKMRRVHLRVDLRRRQARVSEEFLERPQIGAACEQVRCKTVPERMRRQCFRQAEADPRRTNRAPHEVGAERPSPRPYEEW